MTRYETAKVLKLQALLKQLESLETDISCDAPVMRKKLTKQASKLVDFLLKMENYEPKRKLHSQNKQNSKEKQSLPRQSTQ